MKQETGMTEEIENDGCVTPGCYLNSSYAKDRVREAEHDPVNHPSHYCQGGIECIDAIRAALTPEEFRGFCKGSIFKYVWRERHKGGDESMAKARFYIDETTGKVRK